MAILQLSLHRSELRLACQVRRQEDMVYSCGAQLQIVRFTGPPREASDRGHACYHGMCPRSLMSYVPSCASNGCVSTSPTMMSPPTFASPPPRSISEWMRDILAAAILEHRFNPSHRCISKEECCGLNATYTIVIKPLHPHIFFFDDLFIP
jgi:hypothetical protein